jgi:hypothetical protein
MFLDGLPDFLNLGLRLNLNINGDYTITVSTPGYYGQYVKVWIDYNQNNVFDGAPEIVGQGHINGYSSATIPITISATAPTGITGLRVIATYDAYGYPTNPCGSYEYGNCSDFSVNILPALTPPTVITMEASEITGHTAVMNSTVNANGYLTNVAFNYGLTTAYGSTLAGVQSPVIGNTDTIVNAPLTGLLANTTYHYKAFGTGVGGTIYGLDTSFVTSMIPPDVVTTGATNIAGLSAYLNGTVNPNNLPSTISFAYGLTTDYGDTIVGTPSNVSGSTTQASTAFISGLTMNTLYHYRIISANSVDTSVGNDMTFTTLPTLYCIPTYQNGCNAPWYMGLTYVGLNTISQSIPCTGSPSYYHDYTTSSTDLARNGSYSIAVQTGSGYGLYINVWIDYNHNNYFDGASEIAGQGHINANSSTTIPITVSATSLVGETRIRIMSNYDGSGYPSNPCGWNYYGNCSDFTVNILNPGPPIVATKAASQLNVGSATLNGFVTANYFESTVLFEYGLTDSYGSTIAGSPSPLNGGVNTAVSATLTGLDVNTTYHYRISATNSAGTTPGNDTTFTTTPTAVFNVTGGGSYCSTSAGLSVGLSGSEVNATYQLFKNSVAEGSPISGTGSALSWDNLSNGTYTIEATAPAGSLFMTGNAVIS